MKKILLILFTLFTLAGFSQTSAIFKNLQVTGKAIVPAAADSSQAVNLGQLVDSIQVQKDSIAVHRALIDINVDSIAAHNLRIIDLEGLDTTGIYHSNRAALDLVSGTNTGNQTLNIAGTTSPTITLSGSNTATFNGVGIISLGQAAGTITITGTEVDGSITNELQTVDTLDVSGNLVRLSLSNDGEIFNSVDISTATAVAANTAKVTMTYPAAGIPLSTGTAWGASITNNSTNWNTAYGWGNHASAGYGLASALTTHANLTTTAHGLGASAFHADSYFQLALTNPVTGTGTSGYIPKFTGTSTIGNSPIYTDGNNVGIGTTGPTDKLSVTAGAITVGFGNNDKATLTGGSGFGSLLHLYNFSAVETVRLDAGGGGGTSWINGGNVGIGTTGPVTKLEIGVGDPNPVTDIARINTVNTNVNALTISNWDGAATTYGPRILFDNSGRGSFTIGGSNGANNFDIARTWGTPDLRIDVNGNVGIGYSTGTEIANNKLAVNGTGYFNGVITTAATGTSTNWNTAFNHTSLTNNPHSVTATQVGLSLVNNTSDLSKPISTATQTALDLKEDNVNKNAINGYAGLDGSGKINPSQLPVLAITETFVVISQAAMLALTAETGDIAIRTDQNKSYILKGTNPALLADWQELLTPTDLVQSVFGRSGVVTAQANDYTADQIQETATRVFVTPVLKTAITHSNRISLDLVSGTNTGDQTTISGITGTKAQFNTSLTDGNFMYIGDAPTAHNQAWSTITSTPTTLAGYGITDAQALDADLTSIATLAGTTGLLRKTAANTWTLDTLPYSTTVGTVTSVAMTTPTGLSVSGSPVTSAGTLALSLAAGYSIPTTASQTNWNTAYGWGNWATGVTKTFVDALGINADLLDGQHGSYYQPLLTNPVTGTGTSGYIPKFTGTSTIGNSPIYTDGTNVGIGTVSPGAKLEVGNYLDAFKNTLTIASQYQYEPELNFRLGQSGTGYDWSGAKILVGDDGNYNGKIEFRTANGGRDTPTTKMIIKASGNVGIGYSTGTEITNNKLAVNGNGYFNGVITTAATGTSTNWNTAYTDRLKWDGGATGLVAATGRASLGVDIAGTDNSTNVTLNANATTAGLSLLGQELRYRAATAAQNGYLTSTDWSTFNNKYGTGTFDTAYIAFTNQQNTFTLGQTINGILVLGKYGADGLMQFIKSGSGAPGGDLGYNTAYGGMLLSSLTKFKVDAPMDVTGNMTLGAYTITAGNFILNSDRRLKSKIHSIDSKPIDIDYKQFEFKDNKGKLRYGVIAQELQKTNPELVTEGADGMLGVSYIDLLIKEIAALKEQTKELKARIEKLEKR